MGILYVLDQTDEGFRPHELSIYTQGNVAMLFYKSIPLLVNIRLLMMMQYDTIGVKYSNNIHISPPATLQSLYRNRKGFLSQNCLFICNFNMLFTYILSGWEGSATDARVWADALAKGFSVPEGFYYLADAGYPHCKELLVPFRGIRYHLQEWGAAGVR